MYRGAGCPNWARPDLWEPRRATGGATRSGRVRWAAEVLINFTMKIRTSVGWAPGSLTTSDG
jgi:hypothetical protein